MNNIIWFIIGMNIASKSEPVAQTAVQAEQIGVVEFGMIVLLALFSVVFIGNLIFGNKRK